MAMILNRPQAQQTNAISGNNYDAVRAYAASQSSVPEIINELVSTYIQVAQTLGITPVQFIQTVEQQGSTQAQQIYLSAYLNSVRQRNALLGVANTPGAPYFIQREIVP